MEEEEEVEGSRQRRRSRVVLTFLGGVESAGFQKETTLNFIGVDLHKKTIRVCVVDQDRKVLGRKRLSCQALVEIRVFFKAQAPFQAVVEARASYEWLLGLMEPIADRLVQAHPQKLRVIAESVKKTDRLEAQVLGEFPALNMIPEGHRPTPRPRAHRRLVRHRQFVMRRPQAVRCRVRAILSDYNADRVDLFTVGGVLFLKDMPWEAEDRFVVDELITEGHNLRKQLRQIEQRLDDLSTPAPGAEAEAREVRATIPLVGPVTIDVVVSELGDIRRLRSAKPVVAYAGLRADWAQGRSIY